MIIKIYFKDGTPKKELYIDDNFYQNLEIQMVPNIKIRFLDKSTMDKDKIMRLKPASEILYPCIIHETERIELWDSVNTVLLCKLYCNIIDVKHCVNVVPTSCVELLIVAVNNDIKLNHKDNISFCDRSCKHFVAGVCTWNGITELVSDGNEFLATEQCELLNLNPLNR